MEYVYPKLSSKDLYITRLGGPGLGNLLFVYSKAIYISKKYDIQMIWPTWNTIKIGTILRKEKDKRFYLNLFKNNCGAISGVKKICLLFLKKKLNINEINEINIDECKNKIIQINEKKIEFNNTLFKDILEYRNEIYENLKVNLINKDDINIDLKNSIVVNIRLGDFVEATEEELRNGANNSRIPIKWYINIINQIREITGKNLKVYVSSDGSEDELKEILKLDNVQKIDFKNSITTIMALTQSPLFIGSGSTFSLWIRFLGQMNSISYKNQYKEKVLLDKENKFEIDTDYEIDYKYHKKIINIYK